MTYVVVIVAYLFVLVGFGTYTTRRRARSGDDFMVAGRSLTAPILVATLLATWIGSGDIFSVADLSYNHGYSSLIGSAGGWLGIIVVYFIAGRVRRFGQYTVPDILEARYDYRARILATITTILAFVTIVSYQFRGGGWVINIISDGAVSESTGMIIMAVFAICYTLLAGMLSLAYLDVVNGVVIIGGVFLAVPFLISNAGGVPEIAANVTPRADPVLGNMSALKAAGYFIPTLLLALGNGNMYQRFFSARDEHEARKAVIGWVIGVIVLGIALQTLAVVGSSMFKGLPPEKSGKIILLVAHDGLPLVVGCILISSIIAIIMSTANSFLLVPATNIMRDIYQRFVNPELSDKKIVLYSRFAVVGLGLCAFALINFFPRILDAAYAAYTVYGAGLTPALMAVFFWKRATKQGGFYSILTGMLMTIGWEIAKKILGHNPFGLPAVYPALVLSIFVLIVVSLNTPPPEKDTWSVFYKEA